MVPQDPYLFAGTIRQNLDRFGNYTATEIERALTAVQLDAKIDDKVEEGGKNLSLGERQLLCLARAILFDKPIVLMDEPTSSVDTITDTKIQNLISSVFKDRTLITIAHRLETLAAYDLIVEIQDGKMIRCGSPGEIIPTLRPDDVA